MFQKPKAQVWTDGLTALKDALTLEASVTRNISDIAKVCEEQSFNDYHVSSNLLMYHYYTLGIHYFKIFLTKK